MVFKITNIQPGNVMYGTLHFYINIDQKPNLIIELCKCASSFKICEDTVIHTFKIELAKIKIRPQKYSSVDYSKKIP